MVALPFAVVGVEDPLCFVASNAGVSGRGEVEAEVVAAEVATCEVEDLAPAA